jgi:hypothetical protein
MALTLQFDGAMSTALTDGSRPAPKLADRSSPPVAAERRRRVTPAPIAAAPGAAELIVAARRLWATARATARRALAACIASVDRALARMGHNADRALWWLGYTEIEIVEEPRGAAKLAAPQPRAGERIAGTLGRRTEPGPHERVTAVYPIFREQAERADTENERDRAPRGAVISLARHRASR